MDISFYKNEFDYESIEEIGLYTEGFTQHLDEIEMLDFDHKFFTYLDAIANLEEIKQYIVHGYYHKGSKRMKMIVRSTINRKLLNIIYHAWSERPSHSSNSYPVSNCQKIAYIFV